ncbi:MAG: hypothetical protein IJ833_06055 [Lachnospiraceae bacterium]|nr:hypothetical protein [Lachnospiraceae bacterium]
MAAYRIAVGTLDGQIITEHFGRAKGFRIIEVDQETDEEKPLADIEVVHSEDCGQGHDKEMLESKIQALLDWQVTAILVARIGPGSERLVTKNGIQVLVSDGEVETAMVRVKRFFKRHHFS